MEARAWKRAAGALGGALAASVLLVVPVRVATAGSGTTAPQAPQPTIGGTIVPGTVIVRATTTAVPQTQAPRTDPPATQAPATQSPRTQAPATQAPRTTVATTLPPTTRAATTVATTVAPTSAETTVAEEPSTTVADETVVATTVASAGDSAASERNSRIAWALALMGLLVGGLTVWFWYATRPVPVGMAGLAEMGTPRWWRADSRKREQLLDRSRKGFSPVDEHALVVPMDAAPGTDAADPVADELPAWARGGEPASPPAPPSWPMDVDAPMAVAPVDVPADATPPRGLPLPALDVPPVEAPAVETPAVEEPAAVVVAEQAASAEPGPEPLARPLVDSPWAPPRGGGEPATAGDHG